MSARRLRLWLLTLVPSLIITLLPAATPASAASRYPRVMAATGDSITRAYNVGWFGAFRDNPAYSWSTGTAVYSHYRRLLTVAPQLTGRAYNDARSGARMSELQGQLAAAAGQGAEYVTVLMGANDICTSTIAAMTPTATFEAQFRAALASFVAARPKARVFVSSIPDVYRLWEVLHTNPAALFVWQAAGICQSMLNVTNTEEQRQQVVAQQRADNDALARVCAAVSSCRWDGYAVYNTRFSAADVSTVDYFHPSASGEGRLASVTWAAGYWPTVG
jgi:lysophospholipase L1-like esterase